MALNRRDFEVLRDRISKLESKMAALETKVKTHESKLVSKELYRVIKTEEKAKEIESQMGMTEKPL